MLLGDIIVGGEMNHPENVALIFRDVTISYSELAQGTRTLAQTFHELGIRRGDTVALLLPNCPQSVCGYYACALLGAIVVPANPLLKPSELEYIWGDCAAQIVVTVPPLAEGAKAAQQNLPNLRHVLLIDPAQPLSALTRENLAPNVAPSVNDTLPPEIDENSCAVIIYTSGTTGRPKGAMLSHRNLMRNVEQVKNFLHFTPEDRFFTVLPLFHSFAGTICQNVALSQGCASVLVEQFAPAKAVETILKHGVTILPGIPTMFYALLQALGQSDVQFPSLRIIVSGGAPLPVAILQALEARLGVPVLEGDGPTECSPVTSVNPMEGVRKVGSVGLPLPGVEVAIFDDDDNTLPAEEIGEIVVRGDNVMLGYLNQPEATAEAMRSGWYHTGDMGRIDSDGYVYIVDRKKDMIITTGFNVYPREVEEVLFTHPAVAIAAVIGLPDAARGEEVVAVITRKPNAEVTERELISYCRERLARYKSPRRVIFREAMPLGGSGKVLKRLLKKELDMESEHA